MNNAFYIIVQRINLYEIFHTKDTNLFHRSFYPISTREESKSNECRSKTRKMIPYSRYERRRRRRQEKIDGGQSKHPEETAFRTGIKVIAER